MTTDRKALIARLRRLAGNQIKHTYQIDPWQACSDAADALAKDAAEIERLKATIDDLCEKLGIPE